MREEGSGRSQVEIGATETRGVRLTETFETLRGTASKQTAHPDSSDSKSPQLLTCDRLELDLVQGKICPIPQHVQRSLGDRSPVKRKNAALEIKSLVKSYVEANNLLMVHSIIKTLAEHFCSSLNSNYRKGALIVLAAIASEVVHHSHNFMDPLLPPILRCLEDETDSRACGSLYTIVKESRGSIRLLPYLKRISVDGLLAKLVEDDDPCT